MKAEITRETAETQITLVLDMERRESPHIDIPLPFFSHMLSAMAFHGGFYMSLEARGDIEVDPHHLVEDIGLVMGEALLKIQGESGRVHRYGHSVIPMDEALSEVTVDVCGRPSPVLLAQFPQERCGEFDTALTDEFWKALTGRARMALHGQCRYGNNSHHMVEALFKALGKALATAYAPLKEGSQVPSTKGTLTK